MSICATRTGCGKSQTTRFIADRLREKGYKVVAVRHPMPYDPDLTTQICQRYADYPDLDKYNTTIEEREEYEPHIDKGVVLFAGVDYAVGTIKGTFEKFPHLDEVLPAMGYSDLQRKELEETINSMADEVDVVIAGTLIDLTRIIDVKIPLVRVRYSLAEIGKPSLGDIIDDFVKKLK